MKHSTWQERRDAPLKMHMKRAVLCCSVLCSLSLGMLVALGTDLPLVTLAGILVVGLALANIVPVIFSLAGDIIGERTGQVSSQITVVSYVDMLLGPATIGGLAELVGLRMALASIILPGIMITLLSLQIRER
jgi:MFS family permease